jgi:hypothetical protein
MPRSRRLFLERLEDRSTPSTSGVTWPDGGHLTLSFVPDGTQVAGQSSSLFSKLNAVAPSDVWQREIVRAFQTWASQTNVNVGVVADGGQTLGTTAVVQGDNRFGDIRIAAIPMAAGTLITNTAFQWSGTSWSGDIVINTAYRFSVGSTGNGLGLGIGNGNSKFDLYTAMLNEAGNVFGVLDNTTDPLSAVYHVFNKVKSGLTSGDVSDIRAQYGERAADAYDAAAENGTNASATNLGLALTGLSLEADVTYDCDVDYYRFSVPILVPGVVGLKVKVTTSGLSTLTPTLDVYNANGWPVGSASATSPLNGNLSVQVGATIAGFLTQLLGGSTYTVRVAGNNNTAFDVGGYKLDVSLNLADGTIVSMLPGDGLIDPENGANDLLATALALPSRLTPAPDARFDYTYKSSISSGGDVDYYKVVAATGATCTQKMNVLVWALNPDALHPRVDVYDAEGNAVAAQLLANENGTFAIEVGNTTPGADYYVKLSALGDGHDAGNYFLGADFNTNVATTVATLGSNTLSQSAPVEARAVTVTKNRLFEFILAADTGLSGQAGSVTMQILDAAGTVVFSLTATAGRPASTGHAYLKAGNYVVRLTTSDAGPVNYLLTGRLISDPIGPQPDDGSGSSDPPPSNWDGSTGTPSDPNWDQPYYW